MQRFVVWMLSLCIAFFVGCRRGEPPVVVYVSADEYVAHEIISAYETKTGLAVKMVGDTEAKKTTGLVERLRAEKANPRADVFWSSEIFMTIDLANEGMFAPYESPTTLQLNQTFCDPDDRWSGFAGRARVIVYSPERVAAENVPDSWMDLVSDRFKSRVVMADPRFGTTGGHLAAMKVYWEKSLGPGFYEAFIDGLVENDVRLLASGNAGVVEAVARGEADIGMTDTDDVWAAQARGLKVQLVYPSHHPDPNVPGSGTLLIPNTAAIVANSPNPEEAKRFIDFLLSDEVERMLAKTVSHNVPLRPSVAAEFPEYAVANPLVIDFAAVAAARVEAVEMLMSRIDGTKRE